MNPITPVIDLFYPRICLRCGRKLVAAEKYLCVHCLAGLPVTDSHIVHNNPVANAIAGRIKINEAYAWFYHSRKGSYGELIYGMKYASDYRLARHLGYLYAKELKQAGKLKDIAYIIPVPLHKTRKRTREYNQSEKIAEGIAPVLEARIRTDILERKRATPSQVSKTRYERWENMQDAFRVTPPPIGEEEKGILLVDDVITTGSTLLACAEALETAGYKNISVLGLAFSNIQ